MQTARLVQAVALMIIVALAASCAASKEYSSKLFAPRNAPGEVKDTQALALRFLELDNVEPNKEDWVSTDIIMGRDTANKTFVLDNFSKSFPATPLAPAKKDSSKVETEFKTAPVMVERKPTEEPVARTFNPGEVRTKKTRTEK